MQGWLHERRAAPPCPCSSPAPLPHLQRGDHFLKLPCGLPPSARRALALQRRLHLGPLLAQARQLPLQLPARGWWASGQAGRLSHSASRWVRGQGG